jgi:hypothetical protein
VNHPRAVATDRRNGQVLLHLRVVQPVVCNDERAKWRPLSSARGARAKMPREAQDAFLQSDKCISYSPSGQLVPLA